MKVIVKVDDSVSKDEVQSWIDDVLMETPCVLSAHVACDGCTCEKEKTTNKELTLKMSTAMARHIKNGGEVKRLKSELQWHDLTENPDDLPKKYIGTVHDVCVDQNDNSVVYFHDSKNWFNLATGQKENVERWASMARVEI